MVAPQGLATARRQRQGDDDRALLVRAEQLPLLIHDPHVVARHGAVARPRPCCATGKAHAWGGDRPAGFGLPPMVMHRLAGDSLQPRMGAGVELFPRQKELAQ